LTDKAYELGDHTSDLTDHTSDLANIPLT